MAAGNILVGRFAAAEPLEQVKQAVRIAELRIDIRLRGLPVRQRVAHGERLLASDAVLAAAVAAFDAGQDIDCRDSTEP